MRLYSHAIGTACSRGQALLVTGASGLPNSSRTACTRTLTGFHDATPCSQPGIDEIGTKALLMNVSGNTTTNSTPITESGDRTTMPIHVPSQIMPEANTTRSRNASLTSSGLVWARHPTMKPVAVSTAIDSASPATSAM
jgi:hypothetical protein